MICQSTSSGVVTLPFLPVRVVCLAWLKRRASQILKTMEEMGHAPKWRGKCIRACESFCWRWLMRQGFSSVAVGCRRPCSPEAMAAALKKWVHFLREASSFLGILHKVDCVCQMLHSAVLFCDPFNLAVMVYGLRLWSNHQSSIMMMGG